VDDHQHPPEAQATKSADPGLDESMLAADPVDQFSAWLADAVAAGLPEPNAMVLSTVSAAGRPRSGGPSGVSGEPGRSTGR